MKADKNGKINGKFNIIDALVIILIVVVVAGIGIRFKSSITDAVKSDTDFRFVVKIAGVRQFTVDALEKGGIVTDKKSEKVVGEIEKVETADAQFQSTTASGDIIETILPERYNCLVTIRATGKEGDNAYYTADENELSVGHTMEIYTKYVKTSGEIQEIEVLNQ